MPQKPDRAIWNDEKRPGSILRLHTMMVSIKRFAKIIL